MQSSEATTDEVHLTVENVGGIESTSVELGAGVSVLTGRNATNRTSFLRALMGALGSDGAALKADADHGRVELAIGDETYTRTFDRRNGTVVTGGDPFLADPTLADRFAFLLESNAARRAVRAETDLHDVLMEPVDTAAIEGEIDRLRRERDQLDRRLTELDEAERRLGELEARRDELTDQLESRREELAATRDQLADADVDPSDDDPVTEALSEVRDRRAELEEVEFRLASERESREALEDERADLDERLEAIDADDGADLGRVEAELDTLREERRRVDALVTQLGSVVSFNRERLGSADDRVAAALSAADGADGTDDTDSADGTDSTDGTDGESVTDSLLGGDEVTCWTCGEAVPESQVESTVDRLEDIRDEQLARRRELDTRIDDLEAARKDRTDRRTEREQLEAELRAAEAELDDRAATIDDLKAERETLFESIESLESEVANLESETYDDLLALHREANELEFEVDRLVDERETVEADLEAAEAELAERDRLLERRGELTEELASLRTRIEDIEREAVAAFNDHMETVLDILAYDNIARVWIERIEREGAGPLSTDARFDLHVVRETGDGAAYEDSVANLSESEREVVGFVFALAGYLVHEVYEEVPFMLLDSLEAIDSDRISALVDYVADFAPYLVVALLPEDAAALDDDYRRVTEI